MKKHSNLKTKRKLRQELKQRLDDISLLVSDLVHHGEDREAQNMAADVFFRLKDVEAVLGVHRW